MVAPTTLDITWVLLCAFLVLLMQPGFLCLEVGLVRAQNGIHVALKKVLDLCVSGIIFWMVGYGMIYGDSVGGWLGDAGWFATTTTSASAAAFFLYQMAFCGTVVTVISSALAERMRLLGYVVLSAITAFAIYPIIGHWVWGGTLPNLAGGWLRELGFVDFAGGTVVHSTAGWVALAAIMVLAPRTGRFERSPLIYGQNLPVSALGVLLIWIGWMGFTGGSLFEFSDRVPLIAINTMLAGIGGGGLALVWSQVSRGRVLVAPFFIGILAGLVSVTAGVHAITPMIALIVGAVGSLIAHLGVEALERAQVDDVIAAVPVHALAGTWGSLAVGLFGDLDLLGTGLTRTQQIWIQVQGSVACFIWAFGTGFILLATCQRFVRLRPVAVEPHTEVGQIAH